MGARNNVRSSKESDANKDIRCFLITMDKDGQISAENEATSPQRGKTSKDSLSIGKCTSNVKPKKNRSVCSASIRQDTKKTKDLHAVSGESKAALSMDNIDIDIQGLDEIQRDGSPPRFIKICDRVLSNRPSFVLLEDASTKNKDKLDNSDLSRTESYHAQQQTSPSVVSSRSNVGCQTDEKCSEEDGEPSNNSCCEGNEGNDVLSEPTDVPASAEHTQCAEAKLQPHKPANQQQQLQQQQQQLHHQQQQQQQHATSCHSPYMTISFMPLSQAGSKCGTSVAPCQHLPRASMSNVSPCSCCTSNCCLPRSPQVCQMTKTTCCSPGLAASQKLGLLTPYGYPYCCCSRSVSCWPVSGLGHYNRTGMVVSNQISQLFQPVLSTTGFTPGGSFHTGINPYLGLRPTCSQCSHCSMNVHHYPHCTCSGFVKKQQQFPLQMGQQFPLQIGQQCPLKMGQLPQQGTCACSLKQRPKKAVGSEVSGDGLNHVFSKVPQVCPRVRTQPLSEDQENQEQGAKNKSSTEEPLAYPGASNIKSNFNTTTLYAARSGRTCLILRPTATAMVPRLLTRRISRYTSVIMAPKFPKQ